MINALAGASHLLLMDESQSSHKYLINVSQGFSTVNNMIRRILLILMVLAIPAGLASASQALADTANPPIEHQQPIVVQLDSTSNAPASVATTGHGDNDE